MNKKWILPAILAAVILLAVFFWHQKKNAPAEKETTEKSSETVTESMEETAPPLPDAMLYYGEILEIERDEKGLPVQLFMDSQRSGEYVMNLGDPTCYVDSGERKAFDPSILQVGDRVYVYHSPIAAMSLPPQSPAFVILRNIPMDAGCGMYYQVEAIRQEEDQYLITTDNGKKTLGADENTQVFSYHGDVMQISDLQEGDTVIAWYWDRGETVLHPSHLMVLPSRQSDQ